MDLERIGSLDRDSFWRDYVLPGKPVIITDLMAGTPVAGLRTRERAIESIGRMPMTIRPEYGRSLLSTLEAGPNTSHAPETVSLRGYFRIIDNDPTTSRMCIEEPTPKELSDMAPVPKLCTDQQGGVDEHLKSTIFVGNGSNCAPLHYDGDARHVLLYQVFGTKAVTLIPPQHGAALRPIANFSTLRWAHCDANERYEILDELGGSETVIGPGEAIFMPALWYHAADYLEDGMSVNFRFGRNRYHELFSAHVHLDPNAQRLLTASLAESTSETELRDAYRQVADLVTAPTPTSWLKRERMATLFEELCADLGDDPVTAISCSAFVDLPPIVVEALHRAHIFKEQLYRQRTQLTRDNLDVPIP